MQRNHSSPKSDKLTMVSTQITVTQRLRELHVLCRIVADVDIYHLNSQTPKISEVDQPTRSSLQT
jgi:hypothetical protein